MSRSPQVSSKAGLFLQMFCKVQSTFNVSDLDFLQITNSVIDSDFVCNLLFSMGKRTVTGLVLNMKAKLSSNRRDLFEGQVYII